VLNTILYNWKEGIESEVNKGLRKTSTSTAETATIASTTRTSRRDNIDAVVVSNADALFDRKIQLITEGIDTFFNSKLKELTHDNALTIVNYILSMKNEINLSDNYRRVKGDKSVG
jgi:hypothetical protein